MRRNSLALIAAYGVAFLPVADAVGASPESVGAGENLFVITCSSSYCHGGGGAGGKGPSLQNRNFSADFIETTILHGRSGTPMPAFKDTLSPAEIGVLVDYVMSLSPGGPTAAGHAASLVPAAKPVGSKTDPNQAEIADGTTIFFDATRTGYCSACHSFQGKGGPIGPDLTEVSRWSPRDIYAGIAHPKPANAAYPMVAVTLHDGTTLTGIEHNDHGDGVRLYDMLSIPPVLRTILRGDVMRIEPVVNKVAYQHSLSQYAKKELLDLVIFLKSADPDMPAAVTVQDLNAAP